MPDQAQHEQRLRDQEHGGRRRDDLGPPGPDERHELRREQARNRGKDDEDVPVEGGPVAEVAGQRQREENEERALDGERQELIHETSSLVLDAHRALVMCR